MNLAAHFSCRPFFEQFILGFVYQHSEIKAKGFCGHSLVTDASMSDVLKHFEVCPGVTSRIGDEGCSTDVYQKLSECIRHYRFKDDHNCVIIPNDLGDTERHLIIGFLMANDYNFVIATHDGGVREPLPEEMVPPDKNKKAKTK